MNIYRDIGEINKEKNTVISVGTFDGVHKAHRQIIEKVIGLAARKESRSLLITFDPHPQEVLRSRIPDIKLLTTTDEKLALFELLGVENVLIIKFTMEFSRTRARDFYKKLINDNVGISDLVVGYDHGFGKDREGDLRTLSDLSRELGFSVQRVEEIDINGERVSSSRIRKHLAKGEIEEANYLLGYEYGFEAAVIEGDKMGKALGYPTANLKPFARNKLMPKDGVYCVKVNSNGTEYYGMMNIGYRPTVSEGVTKVIEVNIFDFDGSIYGEKLRINFLKRLRSERKFSSKEELAEQLKRDREASMNYLIKQSK